jgi:hypothetical protein
LYTRGRRKVKKEKEADFCIKTLSVGRPGEFDMDVSESFAYNVGTIARLYIDFKNRSDKIKNNSMRDIMTYNKYDREKLQFVVRRICLGINLSKAKEEEITQITRDISRFMPQEEIPSSDASNDYSYFFYKGYFQGGSKNK